MSSATLHLTPRLALAWEEGLTDQVREVGPREGSSFLVTPGPRRRPSHSRLDPSASPRGRIAARILSGSREPEARVLLAADGAARFVELAYAPLAIAARDDGGFWAMDAGQIVQHDAEGGTIRSVAASAVALIAARDDMVWAVGLDDALVLDAQGRELGRFPWRGGPHSAPAADGGLAVVAPEAGIQVLKPDGSGGAEASPGPPVDAHERLQVAGPDAVITAVGGGIRRRAAGGLEEVPLQAAGLAQDGLAWISGRLAGSIVELRLENDVRRYDLGAQAPAQGPLRVVAVEGDVVTVLGPADAWELADGNGVRHVGVDDTSYRDAIFPVAWELASVVGTPSGSVLVSASGATGVAVIELSWA